MPSRYLNFLNDKVKLLSVTELGYSHPYAAIEGNKYYIYLHCKNMEVYWLRTRCNTEVWSVDSRGYVNGLPYSNGYYIVPVIRLGKV